MRSFIFRTNAGQKTGLGHLVRCAHLARELVQSGARCLFVIDYIEDGVAPFLDGLDVCALYDAPQEILGQRFDAQLFLEIAQVQQASWVILDDYRLHKEWENTVQNAGFRLCVIDDLLRPHQCDALVDIRWRGEDTQFKYDALVPITAQKLLGPSFVMLAANYRNITPPREEDASFTIMIGCGNDLSMGERIIDTLLAHQDRLSKPIHLVPVLGPFSKKVQDFVQRYQVSDCVTPLVGETELYPYLCKTDFYIGAAGGMLYQLIALKIPALTFSIAENQQTDLHLLEDIGHFFYVGNWPAVEVEILPAFIATVQYNYERIKKMGIRPKVALDGFGTQRIAQVLLDPQHSTPCDALSPVNVPQYEEQILSVQHHLRPVCDQDINHYRISRNLDANCQNMISDKKIPALHHYVWWYNTQRESFLLTRNNAACLYIWHEVKACQGREFLVGGWFVCSEATGFQDSLLALNWQLEYCDKHFSGIPWIAVIHRQNKYVKLMNDYVGFQEVTPETPHWCAILEIFKGACSKDFYFVTRKHPLRV